MPRVNYTIRDINLTFHAMVISVTVHFKATFDGWLAVEFAKLEMTIETHQLTIKYIYKHGNNKYRHLFHISSIRFFLWCTDFLLVDRNARTHYARPSHFQPVHSDPTPSREAQLQVSSEFAFEFWCILQVVLVVNVLVFIFMACVC